MYLKVNVIGTTREDLVKEFRKLIKARKKAPLVQAIENIDKIARKPFAHARFEELQRYLRIYDKRQKGLQWNKIVEEETGRPDDKKYDFQNLIRKYMKDAQKARKIIKNVEKGVFPGDLPK